MVNLERTDRPKVFLGAMNLFLSGDYGFVPIAIDILKGRI